MFCKHCGGQLKGTTCTKCGKKSILVKRSSGLEDFMAENEDIIPQSIPHNTGEEYKKGLVSGYANGKRDGYEQGYKAGQEKLMPWLKHINKLLIAAPAALFALIVFSSLIGFNIGSKQFKDSKAQIESASSTQAVIAVTPITTTAQEQPDTPKESPAVTPAVTSTPVTNKQSSLFTAEAFNNETKPTPGSGTPTESPSPQPPRETSGSGDDVSNLPETSPIPKPQEDDYFIGADKAKGDVQLIQAKLKKLGYSYSLEMDFEREYEKGIFGKATKQAVKKFQEENSLQVDGIVGKETLKALWPDHGEQIPKTNPNRDAQNSDPEMLTPTP